MKKLKTKVLIFTSAFSLLLSDITFCQWNSRKSVQAIKEHTLTCNDSSINIIAHRGFSSIALDNSQEAIDVCQDYSCIDGIEIDIRLTSDNNIVLNHNKSIKTENNKLLYISEEKSTDLCKNKIKNNTFKRDLLSIKHLFDSDMGALKLQRKNIRNTKNAKLLKLDEFLSQYHSSKELLIDIKYNEDIEKFNEVLKELLKDRNDKNIILQSFDVDALVKLKKLLPQFQYQIITNDEINIKKLKEEQINRVGLKYTLVNYKKIDQLRKEGFHVSIWTINSYSTFYKVSTELREYYDDVTYISNYPDCICYWVKQKKK